VTVRDERAAALRRRYRDLGDNFAAVLPRVLDDLDAIDRAQFANVTGIVTPVEELTDEQVAEIRERWEAIARHEPPAPTDEQIAAWIERNPKAFADWAAKQVKVAAPTPTRRRTRT
jgi:AAA+ superfamily predicted ATPase